MRRALLIGGCLLTLAGSVFATRALWIRTKAVVARVLIDRAWQTSVTTGKPVSPWSWADTHPVAKLMIPSINYSEYVLEGASPRAMAFGPTRMSSGARPGEPGNLVLA